MKACPHCGKQVKDASTVCKWCHEALSPTAAPGRVDDEISLMRDMTDAQRVLYQGELMRVRKNPTTALLLTLFLGGIGAHHFYFGRTGLGLLYLLCSWTLIPAFVALIEMFGAPSRARTHNMREARRIAAQIRTLSTPPSTVA